jgi:CHASE1-domain containing sensor protein
MRLVKGRTCTATQRIRLAQEAGDLWGVLVLVPTYRSGSSTSTVSERRAAFQRFSAGVYRLGDLLASAVGDQLSSDMTVCLYDITGEEQRDLLPSQRATRRRRPLPQADR